MKRNRRNYYVALVFFGLFFCFTTGFPAGEEQLPADLGPIKEEYEKTIKKISEDASREIVSTTIKYRDRLKAALDQCMEEHKLDEAIAIKQEMDRVRPWLPATEEGLREGLVLHFTFDKSEEKGKTTDKSSQSNDGKVSGAHWTSKGIEGGAFEFKDDGDQIRVPNKSSLNPKQITLSVWIKTNHRDGKARRIIDKSYNQGMALSIMGDMPNGNRVNRGKVIFEIGPNHWQISNAFVADGRWHHIAAIYSGNAQGLYIDGQIQRQTPQWIGIVPPNNFDLTIGSNRSTPPEENGLSFRGILDEVMMFNRVLTGNEIKLLYESLKTTK